MPRVNANIELYRFECASLDPGTFKVVSFSGEEELSRLFRFELDLTSTDPAVPFADVINKPATFTLTRGDEGVPIHGIVSHIEQAGRTVNTYAYRVVLVPKLWRLSLYHQSRIFQDKSVGDVIKAVLDGSGFSADDYRMQFKGSYAPMPYCVQYRESDLNFISRLMEHEGICYYFDQSGDKEVLVIADDRTSHEEIAGDAILLYDDAVTLLGDRQIVQHVVYREQTVTGKVVLKDYHYATPDTSLKVESQVNSDMPGLYYDYGGHYADASRGKALAKVRNQEMESRRIQLTGQSNCPGLRPGYLFSMEEHYREDLNDKYLVTRLEHRGSQRRAMGTNGGASGRPAGITDGTSNTISFSEAQDEPEYENTFTCIPASVQFRPARVAPAPNVAGVMTAKLETAGGDYAYVDEKGEYRAKMHFDLGSASGGKASLPIRMSQPYSGPNYGIHFPNHAGTEVVFACIDGDVNRPMALGTVPNPNNGSPVKSDNKMQNVIKTMAGNEILLDDTKEKSQIQIKTTDGNSVLFDDKDDRIVIATTNKHTVTIDDKNENIEVKTKDGHVFLMDDKNKKMALQTKDGHVLSISDQDQLMVIKDKNDKNSFTIDIGNDKLIIKTADGNIDILAPNGTIKMESKALEIKTTADTKLEAANFDGKAQVDWKMKANNMTAEAQMEFKQKGGMNLTSEAGMAHKIKGMQVSSEGSLQNDVKGLQVGISGSVMAQIQAAIVKIN